MPVETDADRAAFVADFGEPVVWTRAGIPQPAFLAIFDRPTVAVEFEAGTAGTFTRVASLSCPEASLPVGAAEDDPVGVAGGSFRCAAIRPDGTGWCAVDLKR
jgi:hypothetical protein